MFNEVMLLGTIAADPEYSSSANGTRCIRSRLRIDEPKHDSSGTWVTWVPIVAYGKVGDNLSVYDQGDLVTLRGKLTWQGQQEGKPGGLLVMAYSVGPFAVPQPVAADA